MPSVGIPATLESQSLFWAGHCGSAFHYPSLLLTRITSFSEASEKTVGPRGWRSRAWDFGGFQMMIVRKIGTWAAVAGLLTTVLAIGGQAAADGRSAKGAPQDDTKMGVWFGGFDVVKD